MNHHPVSLERERTQAGARRAPGSEPRAFTDRRRQTASQHGNRSAAGARNRGARLSAEAVGQLVDAAALGEPRAWDALVGEFSGLVWAVARAHRLNEADAADVAQATWLSLFEHLGQIKDPTRVGAWLATTARRESLRILQRGQRLVLFADDAPYGEASDAPADEALLTCERDEALWRSFSRLRETDQTLLRVLMAEPRPDYQEISAALGMPIGSIGPTRARALRRLREQLDRDGALALVAAA